MICLLHTLWMKRNQAMHQNTKASPTTVIKEIIYAPSLIVFAFSVDSDKKATKLSPSLSTSYNLRGVNVTGWTIILEKRKFHKNCCCQAWISFERHVIQFLLKEPLLPTFFGFA